MANHLITGMPGNGKTLYAIWSIEKRRIADNEYFAKKFAETADPKYNIVREVYYHNIKVKNLSWIKLTDDEAKKWYDLPVGAIIVFDECQEIFPPRSTQSKPPPHVEMTARSRHNGFDLYFITQNPKNYDYFVRGVTEHHFHISRPFGASRSYVSEYKTVKENVLKDNKGRVRSFAFPFPKEVFNWYHSAEVHTHKFNMPKKFFLFLLIPFLLGGIGYGVYSYFQRYINPASKVQTDAAKKADLHNASTGNIKPEKAAFDPADFKPRFDDLPWSAPRYDELTKPTVAPAIMGCMVYQNKCKCMTQQGTYHIATMQFCLVTIENGIFQDFPTDREGGTGRNSVSSSDVSNPQATKQIQVANNQATGLTNASDLAAQQPRQDSNFNLPVRTIQQQYDQKQSMPASGQLYVKGSPDSKVLLGNR